MRELSFSNQAISLDFVNEELFLAGNSAERIKDIEKRISDARKKLLELIRELEIAKVKPAIQPIGSDALENFFTQHPAMRIQIDNGKISLLSANQCVAFHTRRGHNTVARNNDIIYVTLPLYGFGLEFHPDGRVSGGAFKSEIIQKVAGENVRAFGHPHATRARRNYLTFESICNGNNRFIQDWQNIMKANSLSGPVLMQLLSQAAIWMETANLSDMYGTFLAENVPTPDVPLQAGEAIGRYMSGDTEGAPDFLKKIYNKCGLEVFKRCLYSIWLFKQYRQLAGKAGFKNALYEAIKTDLLIMQSEQFPEFAYTMCAEELWRTDEIALRCLEELRGYCPHSDRKALSELYPEIFDMEEYYA